jgi:hypothetical protein
LRTGEEGVCHEDRLYEGILHDSDRKKKRVLLREQEKIPHEDIYK